MPIKFHYNLTKQTYLNTPLKNCVLSRNSKNYLKMLIGLRILKLHVNSWFYKMNKLDDTMTQKMTVKFHI